MMKSSTKKNGKALFVCMAFAVGFMIGSMISYFSPSDLLSGYSSGNSNRRRRSLDIVSNITTKILGDGTTRSVGSTAGTHIPTVETEPQQQDNNHTKEKENATTQASSTTTTTYGYSEEALRDKFTSFVTQQVHFNNWYLGCNDLQFMAPYLRAIMDRLAWDHMPRKRQIIVDVGANNGDDAASILGNFLPITGMCWRFGTPILLLGVEPSPKVFCELVETMETLVPQNQTTAAAAASQQVHMLNIALSDQTGKLIFQDPGNEGGRLIGTNYSHLDPITKQEWHQASQCQLSADSYKKQTSVDYKRHTNVPTYTMDLLMKSMDNLGHTNAANDRIFVLKIDTEGHDYNVLLGAKELLRQKRIEFVIFETSLNSLLKETVKFMSHYEYECYVLSPRLLVPLHLKRWWYKHLDDNSNARWWGNGICAPKGSASMGMLWRMYHSDDPKLAASYDLLYG